MSRVRRSIYLYLSDQMLLPSPLLPQAVERAITSLGSEAVLCVLSTTSCFAPRAPDAVGELAQVCHRHNVAHVVNNAYGLQVRGKREVYTATQRTTAD